MNKIVTTSNLIRLEKIPDRPDLRFEQKLWDAGIEVVVGLDEAGRGAWAGPVAAAAVVFEPVKEIMDILSGVRDSKIMTPRQRDKWSEVIRSEVRCWSVGIASHKEIDLIGIVPATRVAMGRALVYNTAHFLDRVRWGRLGSLVH